MTMKIEPPRGPSATPAGRSKGAAGGEGFTLPAGEAKAAAPAAPTSSVAAVSGLLALQFEGGNRRRQTRRAAAALDTMDRLQAQGRLRLGFSPPEFDLQIDTVHGVLTPQPDSD
jgi:hypothetical protein